MKRIAWLACLAGLVGAASAASASPLDVNGLSSRSIAMGGAVTAAARDYSAIYYNPGRLGFIPTGLGVNILATFDRLDINLKKRPAGVDVPTSVNDAFPAVLAMPTSELPTKRHNSGNDPNLVLVQGGAVYDFNLYWLRAGFAFEAPLNYIAGGSFHFIDEREQFFSNSLQFQLLNRRATTPALMPSLAFRPLRWLGFGATAHIYGQIRANSRMYVPNADQLGRVYASMNIALHWAASAIAGVEIDPLPWFGFGFTFRDKSYYRMQFRNMIIGREFNADDPEKNATQSFDYAFNYSPRKVSHGWRFDLSAVTLSADVAWLQWSGFRAEIPLDYLKSSADATRSGNPYKLSMRDTFEGRAGLEWRALPWLDWRLGVGYMQSPVKRQDGRSNLVDNDKIDTSTGFSVYLPWVKGLSVDVHAQVIALVPRTQTKDPDKILDEFPDDSLDVKGNAIAAAKGLQTNNPGYPGYTSRGLIGSVGGGLTYAFPVPEKANESGMP